MENEIAAIFKEYGLSVFRSNTTFLSDGTKTVFEIWKGDRKLSIYFMEGGETSLLRVWGWHINDEMSDHNIVVTADVRQHIEWLLEDI